MVNPEDITAGLARITKDYPSLANFDIYACGPETSIATLKAFFDKQNFPSEQLFLEPL